MVGVGKHETSVQAQPCGRLVQLLRTIIKQWRGRIRGGWRILHSRQLCKMSARCGELPGFRARRKVAATPPSAASQHTSVQDGSSQHTSPAQRPNRARMGEPGQARFDPLKGCRGSRDWGREWW
jgi:hypothetical protein